MIGQIISHYRITRQLGAGGMGVVYEAVDLVLDRPVALKFLPPELARDAEAQARFVHEARAASALDHANVCTVYEIGTSADHTFIAMALVEGCTLKDRIAEGPLPLDETLALAAQVAEGLSHAHDKGVAHRDIKPANLMMTGDGLLKILDFGLARSAEQTRLTRAGTTLGTVAYMSPEQAGGGTVDHRTDLWSLGVVLFEMLAGRTPFGGEHAQGVIHAIRSAEPEPLTALRSGIPLDLERIVARCLAKDPRERYQTAADLLADLRRLRRLAAEPTVGLTTAAPAEAGRRPGRGRWGVAALTAVALLAGVGLARLLLRPGGEPADRKLLAVLPLENLGPAEDEYFADGLTEEITSRLAGLKGLGVISRTSTQRYKTDRPSLREIGRELGVDYVLEGTVRWEHREEDVSRVLVTPQLIRVADDTHLWADRYQRDLAEIFAVQAEIAIAVARQLDVTLLERERRTLAARPTDDPRAYAAYLRGLESLTNPNSREADFLQAVREFERAIALDPDFTMAHVRLAEACGELIFWGFGPVEERARQAETALQRALVLEPDLPEVHRGLGSFHYMVHQDYDRALEEYAIAERGLPNDSELLAQIAYIRRRQGRFDQAIDLLWQAAALDPRDAWLQMQLGFSHTLIRRYDEAQDFYSASIALEGDQQIVYFFCAVNQVLEAGDVERAHEVLAGAPDQRAPLVALSRFWLEMWSRRPREALRQLDVLPAGRSGAASWVIVKELLAGQAYRQLGEPEMARTSFEQALPVLEDLVRENPREGECHSALGVALAGLGRAGDALREGRAGVDLTRRDALRLGDRFTDLARIRIMLGHAEEAIAALDTALSIPGMISTDLAELSFLTDPIKDHPAYRRLLAKHAAR